MKDKLACGGLRTAEGRLSRVPEEKKEPERTGVLDAQRCAARLGLSCDRKELVTEARGQADAYGEECALMAKSAVCDLLRGNVTDASASLRNALWARLFERQIRDAVAAMLPVHPRSAYFPYEEDAAEQLQKAQCLSAAMEARFESALLSLAAQALEDVHLATFFVAPGCEVGAEDVRDVRQLDAAARAQLRFLRSGEGAKLRETPCECAGPSFVSPAAQLFVFSSLRGHAVVRCADCHSEWENKELRACYTLANLRKALGLPEREQVRMKLGDAPAPSPSSCAVLLRPGESYCPVCAVKCEPGTHADARRKERGR
jgi:hypothetical protein